MKNIPETLKPYLDIDYEEQLHIRLNELPSHIAIHGKNLLYSRKIRYQGDEFRIIQCSIDLINTLNSAERMALFTALFPQLAREIEQTYQYFSRLTKLYYYEIPQDDYTTTHVATNTVWLVNFFYSISGFENQNLIWFLNHESHFELGHLLAAQIARADETADKILGIVSHLHTSQNFLVTFLATHIRTSKHYLEKYLVSQKDKLAVNSYDFINAFIHNPTHPSAFRYVYNYLIDNHRHDYHLLASIAKYIHDVQYAVERQYDTAGEIIEYIDNPDKVAISLQQGTPDDIYYALLAVAMQNQLQAVQYLGQILKSDQPENRYNAARVMVRLHIPEVIPLVLDCVSDTDPRILQLIFSNRYGPRNYLEQFLICSQNHLENSDLFERMEALFQNSPKVFPEPHHAFIKYLGDRKPARLEFLGELQNENLFLLVSEWADRHVSGQGTINFLIDILSKKIKTDPAADISTTDIRSAALRCLGKVELTLAQLSQVMDAYVIDDIFYHEAVGKFLLTYTDDLIHPLIVKSIGSRKKHLRLGAMKILYACKNEKRLLPLVQTSIESLRIKKNITRDEFIYLDNVLDQSTNTIHYEDLIKLDKVTGIENLFILLMVLGDYKFSLNPGSRALKDQLSSKIIICFPAEEDTPESFKRLAQQFNVSTQRLIELTFFAPQWRKFVAFVIGQTYEEAVEWFVTHGRGWWKAVNSEHYRTHYRVDLPKYSQLNWKDIASGRVDISWFQRAYFGLDKNLWETIQTAARLQLSPRAWAKIKVYSDAILGKYSTDEFLQCFVKQEAINHVYGRDYMVALGFLPLSSEPTRMKDIIHRYQILQEYVRNSQKYGEKRRIGNQTAGNAGLKHLAETAGYTDLKKFEWAMEAEFVQDLAKGPVTGKSGDFAISLFINDLGKPVLEVKKNNRLIKSIPEEIKTSATMISFRNRLKQLKHQVIRVRHFLEESMCHSDKFTLQEFQGLLAHPLLQPMMTQLVFISSQGMGYPDHTGVLLISCNGDATHLHEHDTLRIAHPFDLLLSNIWSQWQHECFFAKRIQPFKQIFRELYVITETEKNNTCETDRFLGHTIHATKALALFKARGWEGMPSPGRYETGTIPTKRFIKDELTAKTDTEIAMYLSYDERFGKIFFENNSSAKVPLEKVPPIIFSEVMRDIDLVISLADAGDGKWESTTSTVESRAALVRETCLLLNLGNVRIDGSFVLIDGVLSSYKVHLGSGSVFQMPGNYICIIPDNRKRIQGLYLPFIDKDQMAALIISKVILLSQDDQITDHNILNQIKVNSANHGV